MKTAAYSGEDRYVDLLRALDVLGLKLVQSHHNYYFVTSKDSRFVEAYRDRIATAMSFYASIDDIFEEVLDFTSLNQAKSFIIGCKERVPNAFFGCKSYEEVLVKLDLLENSHASSV